MDILSGLGAILGVSWASGVRLYLTVAVLGVASRLGMIHLPGSLSVLENPIVILAALGLLVVEFLADKVPYVDSAWDSVHTFIRPGAAAAMGYMGSSAASEPVQVALGLLCAAVALDSHLTKATARVAINTSPEPFSNIITSFSEDGMVLLAIYMAVRHPVIAGIAVILFVLFSIWFIGMMFRFAVKIFSFLFKKQEGTINGEKAERVQDAG
ncbi:MAG: DUF4126 domain-containing protein [Candidatus Omnitrophica bacterium]|nr:DUF4126 domain-containing protein [Candidatus Omnitrophota bacterium]